MMSQEKSNSRPGLAMIANSLAPYRANLHRLVAEGIPELKLHTLISHGAADFRWNFEIHDEINVQHFGRPEDSPMESNLRRPLYEWRKGGRIAAYLSQNNIQAVILNGYRYFSYLRIIRYCEKKCLPLFVGSDSNIQGERGMSWPKQVCKNWVYRLWMPRVAGWMPCGELGDQFFLKYGARAERLYRVPCTPDYDAFATISPDGLQRFRQKFGISVERKRLLYSGRLIPIKRIDLLIDAFVRLAGDRPEWDLLIVGDGPLREVLGRRVPEHLNSRVLWTGFIEQNELINACHASDVLVLPSERDAWALVIQEAMAAGLAVVSSDVVGAARELISNGTSGRVFPSGDVNSLFDALLEITRPDRLPIYKSNAQAALQQWRERINPVHEIRRALRDVGVLVDAPLSQKQCAL